MQDVILTILEVIAVACFAFGVAVIIAALVGGLLGLGLGIVAAGIVAFGTSEVVYRLKRGGAT